MFKMSRPAILGQVFPFATLNLDLKLLFISNLIGAFGDGLFVYILPIYIRGLGATPIDVGLLFSIRTLSTALTIIPGGFLADRFDRKKVMILGWLFWIPLPLVFSMASHWGQLVLPMILYGVFLSGPATSAYVATRATREKFTLTFTTLSASWSLGYIFSPMLGGYLSAIIGMAWVFFLAFVFYSFAASVLLFMRGQRATRSADSSRIITYSNAFKSSKVIRLSIFFAIVFFFLASVRPLVAQFVQDVFGFDIFHVSVLGSITFLGQAVFLVALGRVGDKWTKMVAVATSLLLSSVSFGLLVSFSSFPLLAFASLLNGGSFAMWSLMNASVGAIAPDESRGRWISLSQTVSAMAAFGGPYLGGLLYESSSHIPFLVVIAVAPLLSVIALAIDRSKRPRNR